MLFTQCARISFFFIFYFCWLFFFAFAVASGHWQNTKYSLMKALQHPRSHAKMEWNKWNSSFVYVPHAFRSFISFVIIIIFLLLFLPWQGNRKKASTWEMELLVNNITTKTWTCSNRSHHFIKWTKQIPNHRVTMNKSSENKKKSNSRNKKRKITIEKWMGKRESRCEWGTRQRATEETAENEIHSSTSN